MAQNDISKAAIRAEFGEVWKSQNQFSRAQKV